MSVKVTNNCMQLSKELGSILSGFLEEVGGEVKSQAQRTVRVDTGQTKGSYDYKVLETSTGVEVQVGSDLENAIYEEFGTGQYALGGNGRKTSWVYKDSRGDWHRTNGKTPTRPIYMSFTKTAPKVKNQLLSELKSIGG